jgi:hypothetical protein
MPARADVVWRQIQKINVGGVNSGSIREID